jgi:hypothetical protein
MIIYLVDTHEIGCNADHVDGNSMCIHYLVPKSMKILKRFYYI